jgi:hypothetical protein
VRGGQPQVGLRGHGYPRRLRAGDAGGPHRRATGGHGTRGLGAGTVTAEVRPTLGGQGYCTPHPRFLLPKVLQLDGFLG